MRPLNLTIAAAALALAACGGQDSETDAASANAGACNGEGVAVSDAWVRAARAGQPATAAYFSICSGGADDAIVAASFAGAGATELHLTVANEDGTASMPQTETIVLPAGETVALKPGGAHIMFIGVAEDIAEGDAPSLRLEFETAPPMDIALEVRDAMGGGGH